MIHFLADSLRIFPCGSMRIFKKSTRQVLGIIGDYMQILCGFYPLRIPIKSAYNILILLMILCGACGFPLKGEQVAGFKAPPYVPKIKRF